MIPDGERYADRVAANTGRYLSFLDRHRMRCTFFTVGDVARRHPELIREIADAGHEIACHSSDHVPLPRHDTASFRDDLQRNIDDIVRAGAPSPQGFRAPIMSLTPNQTWAYEVMAELGLRYSSSVLPAASPMFGWPNYPRSSLRQTAGVWEFPVTLAGLPALDLPFACGVYLRVLPFPLVRWLANRERKAGRATVMYCHPYDVDTEQERFMHPELGGSRWLNQLMYLGRKRLIDRLDALTELLGPSIPYGDYVVSLGDGGARDAPC